MARPGVTQEQVHEAAEALTRAGDSPTVLNVRAHLGGGSPNTINPWLSEWKSMHEARLAAEQPPAPESVLTVVKQVWGIAWESAQTQLKVERSALTEAQTELETERSGMLQEIERLDTEVDQKLNEINQKSDELQTERQRCEQLRSDSRTAQALADERLQQIKHLHSDVQTAQARAEQSADELKQLRTEHTQHQDQFTQEHQARLEVEKQNERLQADLDQSQQAQENLNAEMQKMREEYRQQFQKFTDRLENGKEKYRSAEQRSNEQNLENVRLKSKCEQIEVLQAQLQALTQALQASKS